MKYVLPIQQNAAFIMALMTRLPPMRSFCNPGLGGSLTLFLFEKYLKAKTIAVPIANSDINQHAENENIRLGNLFRGIETMTALMVIK